MHEDDTLLHHATASKALENRKEKFPNEQIHKSYNYK